MKYRCHVLTVKDEKANVERALSGLRTAKDISFVDGNAEGFVTFEIKSSFQSGETWKEIDALIKEKGWPVKTVTERTFNLEDMFIALLTKSKKEKTLV